MEHGPSQAKGQPNSVAAAMQFALEDDDQGKQQQAKEPVSKVPAAGNPKKTK